MSKIEVTAIPAFNDNYIWIITNGTRSCAVIDPGDAGPVFRFLQEHQLTLEYILITHHHADHIGGALKLKKATGADLLGPHDRRIPGQDRSFAGGEMVDLPRLDLRFEVMEVPGHTSSHIAFHGHNSLFCGDTLFSVGCGRLFEGTPQQMQESLDLLSTVPPETLVYCAHEYTMANCEFARAVEPGNHHIEQRIDTVRAARKAGKPSIPSTMAEELLVNPFLRTREESVVSAARHRQENVQPGHETLGVIRAWKDTF